MGRGDDDVRVRADQRPFHGEIGGRAACEGDIDVLRAQQRQDLIAIANQEFEFELGMFGHEGGDQPGREIFGRRHHRHRKPAAAPQTHVLHRLKHLAHSALDRLDMRQRRFAGGVEFQACGHTREQGDAQRLFQAFDPRRQRRGRDMERVRGADQRPSLLDRQQGLKLGEGDLPRAGFVESVAHDRDAFNYF